MAITQLEGPLVVGGRAPIPGVGSAGYTASYNPDVGPTSVDVGVAINDPRWNYRDAYASMRMLGFFAPGDIAVLDVAPATASPTAFATAQVPVAGTALTLTAGTGVTSLAAAAQPILAKSSNYGASSIPAGTMQIGATPNVVTFGSNQAIAVWDPSTMLARAVAIYSSGNDTSATFTVRGYDVYGVPMTETITGANGTGAPGTKAWKWVTSVTPAGTVSGSNVTVGTLDVFGLPLRVDSFPYTRPFFNNTLLTSGTFTAAVTATATSTTGDVRGTIAPSVASDGAKKLTVFVKLTPQNALTSGNTGLFGVTQA